MLCEQSFVVECLLIHEHVIDASSDLGREDADGFGFAVFLCSSFEELSGVLRLADHQCGGLAEGALDVGVADFSARGSSALFAG